VAKPTVFAVPVNHPNAGEEDSAPGLLRSLTCRESIGMGQVGGFVVAATGSVKDRDKETVQARWCGVGEGTCE